MTAADAAGLAEVPLRLHVPTKLLKGSAQSRKVKSPGMKATHLGDKNNHNEFIFSKLILIFTVSCSFFLGIQSQ